MPSNNEPSKVSGQLHSMKGTAVEAIGNATGSQSYVESGKQEHAKGEAELTAARAKEYGEGIMDRMEGKKDAIVGAIKGDTSQEASGNTQQAGGKVKQDMNKNA